MVDPTSHAGEQKEQPASVTFDETVKDGGANDEGGQETEQYTQYDELEDEEEQPILAAHFIGNHKTHRRFVIP